MSTSVRKRKNIAFENVHKFEKCTNPHPRIDGGSNRSHCGWCGDPQYKHIQMHERKQK